MTSPLDAEIDILAATVGLDIATEYREGVRSNLTLLQHYSGLIDDMPLSDRDEPAFEYHP